MNRATKDHRSPVQIAASEIARRPVADWKDAVLALPEGQQEAVRVELREHIAHRKEMAELQRRVDAGIDAVLTFKAGGVMEGRWK